MDARSLVERPATRWVVLGVGALVLVAVVAYVTLLAFQRGQGDTVLAGVRIEGEPVGGASLAEVTAVVDQQRGDRLEEPIVVRAGEGEIAADRETVGVQVDAEATIEEAWRRGRRGLARALWDHLRARAGATSDLALVVASDGAVLARWVEEAAAELTQVPQEGGIELVADDGDTARTEVTEPEEGRVVSADDIRDELGPRLERTGRIEVEVPARTAEPAITGADLDAALPNAELAIDAPVTLTNPSAGDDLVLGPADLAGLLTVEARPDEPEGERLVVHTDGDRLVDHLGTGGMDALEEPAIEAEFAVDDGEVEIVGGTPGFALDADLTASRVVELASREGDREGELAGDVTEPDLSREEAEELGIEEEVSSFTTDLVPGEARNHNIHLGADLFDGSIIHPGDRFSLNEAIGPRTRERGFVENGFIDADGELTEVVGGGSSQLGTTFVNAAWFAGIEIVEFQPHSYYFERYPMGREATLSFGQIDVVVENDSPHAILVATSHTDSSVTVAFYSTAWAEVDTWTGEPRDRVSGAERDGFTIEFGRTITYPDGSTRSEDHVHVYDPED